MERTLGNSPSLDPWFHAQMTKGRWFWERIAGRQPDDIQPVDDGPGR
jgi:hypothetical protein